MDKPNLKIGFEFSAPYALTEQFAMLLQEMSALVRVHGIETVAYESPLLPHFNALSIDDQILRIEDLKESNTLIRDLTASGEIETYNRRLAWSMAKRRGLVVRSDIFSKMSETDIIEVWDTKGMQIFNSFELLKHLSYTLEEICAFPFYQLFQRADEIENLCQAWVKRILDGSINETCVPDVPTHVVRERFSVKQKASSVTPKFLSPVKDRAGKTVGFLYVCSAALISS